MIFTTPKFNFEYILDSVSCYILCESAIAEGLEQRIHGHSIVVLAFNTVHYVCLLSEKTPQLHVAPAGCSRWTLLYFLSSVCLLSEHLSST